MTGGLNQFERDAAFDPVAKQKHLDRVKARGHLHLIARDFGDRLAVRAHLVKFWKRCAETNPHYGVVWCASIYRNPVFWKYLMPKLESQKRATAEARMRRYWQKSRGASERAALAKALKKAPPMPLFDTAPTS